MHTEYDSNGREVLVEICDGDFQESWCSEAGLICFGKQETRKKRRTEQSEGRREARGVTREARGRKEEREEREREREKN